MAKGKKKNGGKKSRQNHSYNARQKSSLVAIREVRVSSDSDGKVIVRDSKTGRAIENVVEAEVVMRQGSPAIAKIVTLNSVMDVNAIVPQEEERYVVPESMFIDLVDRVNAALDNDAENAVEGLGAVKEWLVPLENRLAEKYPESEAEEAKATDSEADKATELEADTKAEPKAKAKKKRTMKAVPDPA